MQASHLSCHGSRTSVSNPSECCRHTPVVLIVDDDEDNLLLMSYVLEPLQCSMITAPDGQSALLAAQTEQPDLIVLDIMLSKLDGIQVVSQLRQNPQTMEIPVVAVTALARDEDRERILEAGCNDYMSKPFMIDALEAMVRRHLHRFQSIP